MAATPDLETSIQQAHGSGQPLADNIREPMEQSFGADFSGVKIHTTEIPPVQLWPDKSTQHLKDRAAERRITEQQIENAVSGGDQYDDPDYPGGTVYYDSSTGVTVCAIADGKKTTCYISARPKSRWIKR